MGIKRCISFNEDDLLKVEQIVLDQDREEALKFIKDVIRKQIVRETVSQMKRERI